MLTALCVGCCNTGGFLGGGCGCRWLLWVAVMVMCGCNVDDSQLVLVDVVAADDLQCWRWVAVAVVMVWMHAGWRGGWLRFLGGGGGWR